MNGWKGFNVLAMIKWLAAAAASAWMSLSGSIRILIILMVLDFVSGLTGAFIQKRINSDVSFRGLARKMMTFLLIYAGHVVTSPLHIGFDLGEFIALGFVANEAISITENCAAAGLAIPPILLQTLAKARDLVSTAPVGSSVTRIQTTETTVIPPANKGKEEK